MTRISTAVKGNRFTIRAVGHATGSVEVCAGVSAILYALAGYLINAPVKVHALRLESGEALLDFEGGGEAFQMAVIGLAQMGERFPGYLQVGLPHSDFPVGGENLPPICYHEQGGIS